MFARMAQRCPLVLLVRKCHLDVSPRKMPQLCRPRIAPFPPSREFYQNRNGSCANTTLSPSIWSKIFGKYLLATNILSSGILMVFGDMIAQEIEYRRRDNGTNEFDIKTERYDTKRIFRMFVVGSLQGPLHHFVYKWMDQVMPVANLKNTLRKILLDQLFMSPVCILIFFYTACYLEKRSLQDTNKELCEKFPVIYMTDWTVWPVVQFMNFRYLDTKYRVLFVNVCTALYNIFLSYMKHDY